MKKPWFYILLSLASGDRYGSDIQDDIRDLSRGEVRLWPATLYGALEELSKEGWIRELDEAEAPADAANRSRFYRMEPAGRSALLDEVERREALTRAARARLGEAGR